MLDRASGKVVHIDFGDCFEVAMTREKFPEKIPFRLTRMLRRAMEATGIDGTFRMTCEHVMDVLRKNRDSLMAVLEAFVHDPLLNWRLLENNNEQTVAASVASNRSPQTGQQQQQQQQAHYQPHLSTVNEEDTEHESTIGGTNQQQQNTQHHNLITQPGRTIRAVEIMSRVREKLTGSDFHREQPVDIPTQVELLIRQATSHENLCQYVSSFFTKKLLACLSLSLSLGRILVGVHFGRHFVFFFHFPSKYQSYVYNYILFFSSY